MVTEGINQTSCFNSEMLSLPPLSLLVFDYSSLRLVPCKTTKLPYASKHDTREATTDSQQCYLITCIEAIRFDC